MRRGIAIAGAAAVLFPAGGLVAEAAPAKEIRYSGRTSQHKGVTLRTDRRGVLTRFSIRVRMDCGNHGYLSLQTFSPPFRVANKGEFHDGGKYVHDYKNGIKVRVRTQIDGDRRAQDRFAGTFDAKHTWLEDGEPYDTCRARNIHWSVTAN